MQWDRFKLKFPMKIGGIVQKVALARFSRTFSALIAAGVPMLEAIDITGKTSGNKVIEKAMDDVRDSVKKGGTLTAPMRAVPEAFPSMVTQMIGVGEETGALETMMTQDRRLLRGRGRGGRQGAHLDPRADHDRRRGRHRRLHRHRDVPADVQGLRPDQVAQANGTATRRTRRRESSERVTPATSLAVTSGSGSLGSTPSASSDLR